MRFYHVICIFFDKLANFLFKKFFENKKLASINHVENIVEPPIISNIEKIQDVSSSNLTLYFGLGLTIIIVGGILIYYFFPFNTNNTSSDLVLTNQNSSLTSLDASNIISNNQSVNVDWAVSSNVVNLTGNSASEVSHSINNYFFDYFGFFVNFIVQKKTVREVIIEVKGLICYDVGVQTSNNELCLTCFNSVIEHVQQIQALQNLM